MNKIIEETNIAILTSIAFLLSACHQENELEADMPITSHSEIGFSTNVKSTRIVNGNDLVDESEFKKVGKFHVFSNYEYKDAGVSKSIPEFQNQLVTYDPSTSSWTYSPKKFWRGTGVYHFRSYFPENADVVRSSSGRNLAINYSIYAHDFDLMVAYRHRDVDQENASRKPTTKVNLCFQHALAGIRFKIEALPEDKNRYSLRRLYARNLYTVGLLAYTLNADSDSPDFYDDQGNSRLFDNWKVSYFDSYNQLYPYVGKNEDYVDKAKSFVSPTVLVIPQKVASGSEGQSKICFLLEVKHSLEEQGELVLTEKEIPPTTWYPGKIYTYLFKVKPDLTLDIQVQVSPWQELQGGSDNIIIE